MVTNITAIVIAPSWPSHLSGYGIALSASVDAYSSVFDRVYYFAVQNENKANDDKILDNVKYDQIYIRKRPKWMQFLLSLTSPLPAVVIPYQDKKVIHGLIEHIKLIAQNHQNIIIIVEDVPLGSLLFILKRQFPHIPVVIRSHNVLAKAFEPFALKGNIVNRTAWSLEIQKIAKLERELLKGADRFWTISSSDLDIYTERYQTRPDGVFGVSMVTERYLDISVGDPTKVLFIGTADLRKGGTGMGLEAREYETYVQVYTQAIPRYLALREIKVHNIFAVIKFLQGWVGLLIYGIMIWLSLRPAIRAWRLYIPLFVFFFVYQFSTGLYLTPAFWSTYALMTVLWRSDLTPKMDDGVASR